MHVDDSSKRLAQDLGGFRAAKDYTAGHYLRRALWETVEAVLVRHSPRWAYAWRRFWINLFGARVDRTACIRHHVRILQPWLLTVGRFSYVGEGTVVYNLDRLTIGRHTLISQDVYLCGGTHDHLVPTLPLKRMTIVIGDGAWVCARTIIGPGVAVGDNSVVGLGSVVTADVPAGAVVAGNPARTINNRMLHQLACELPAAATARDV